jgi:hypothetical protein
MVTWIWVAQVQVSHKGIQVTLLSVFRHRQPACLSKGSSDSWISVAQLLNPCYIIQLYWSANADAFAYELNP